MVLNLTIKLLLSLTKYSNKIPMSYLIFCITFKIIILHTIRFLFAYFYVKQHCVPTLNPRIINPHLFNVSYIFMLNLIITRAEPFKANIFYFILHCSRICNALHFVTIKAKLNGYIFIFPLFFFFNFLPFSQK